MNARAAWRLERLGFPRVFRYAPGKADWKAAGLPLEGSMVPDATALDAAEREPPTCGPDDLVGDVAARVHPTGWETCIVVNHARVVLGRIRGDAWQASERRAEDVMEDGPTTTRADDELRSLVDRMARRHVAEVVVTDPDGRLLGVVRRDVGERLVRRGGS